MELLIALIKVVAITLLLLQLLPLLIWLERKGAAYFQDRRGPNRANILGIRVGGMIHNIADAIKLMTKEEFFPAGANRFYFVLAPFLTMFVYFVTTAVIPFADDLVIGDFHLTFRIFDLNIGLLYILAMTSLAVYGIMLAGWSSNNKYSLLGGLRASSQMISYELAMGLSIVSLFMISQSTDLNDIIRNQGTLPWQWNVFRQPLAFLLFLVASFAEANRTPFDLPEGESELVAGFHVEYSSMKFAMFMMGEYAAIVIASAVITSLFFGGWQIPFVGTQDLIANAPFYMFVVGLVFSAVSVALGLLLVTKFSPKKYKDARRFEVLVFGVPAIVVGVGLGGFLLINGIGPLPEWAGPVFASALQVATFLAKTLFGCFFFIWVRWTLPRFRYDQLMSFGWKGMLPLALFNVFATGVYLLLTVS